MQVGDVVWEVPVSVTLAVQEKSKEYKPIPGTVIYIHPKKRFYVAAFSFGSYTIRESFFFPIKKVGDKNENNRNYEREGWRRKNNHNCKYGKRTG